MFTVLLSRAAEKYYQRVDQATAARLDRCFAILEVDPFGGGDIRPIAGRPGVARYRVGDLRVLYGVDLATRTVTVLEILPRGQAYGKRHRGGPSKTQRAGRFRPRRSSS